MTFSALIESDVPIASERTMTWDAATRYGSHAEQGIPQPATRWYLAEGSTTEFELFYLIFNPEATDAIVDVEYLMPGGASVVRTYTAAADRRTTIRVNDVSGVEATDVSAIVTSRNGVPIVVERSMYRDSPDRVWAAGDSSAGLTATATTWHLAEGATGTFFDTFVLIANPDAAAAEIEARFRKGDGTVVTKAYTVAGRSRFTIWVDAADPALAATDVATTIVSTNGVGIVVERAMWWPGPADAAAFGTTFWSDSHLAAASPVTASRWALADGAQGGAASADTYVLIGNTSAAGGTVQVTLGLRRRIDAGAQPAHRSGSPAHGPDRHDLPRRRRTALLHHRRERRTDTARARRRAGLVLGRRRREMGGRDRGGGVTHAVKAGPNAVTSRRPS